MCACLRHGFWKPRKYMCQDFQLGSIVRTRRSGDGRSSGVLATTATSTTVRPSCCKACAKSRLGMAFTAGIFSSVFRTPVTICYFVCGLARLSRARLCFQCGPERDFGFDSAVAPERILTVHIASNDRCEQQQSGVAALLEAECLGTTLVV